MHCSGVTPSLKVQQFRASAKLARFLCQHEDCFLNTDSRAAGRTGRVLPKGAFSYFPRRFPNSVVKAHGPNYTGSEMHAAPTAETQTRSCHMRGAPTFRSRARNSQS
eukprot:6194469-Pleurochrysis_carterae.AAC.1